MNEFLLNTIGSYNPIQLGNYVCLDVEYCVRAIILILIISFGFKCLLACIRGLNR